MQCAVPPPTMCQENYFIFDLISSTVRPGAYVALYALMIPPFIATATDPTPPSYAESSVETQSPPLAVTASISLVAISFEGAMRVGGCSQ